MIIMEFKKTVAGISAAAIAVTQVAAVIPMGAFAATEDVASSNVQFALNYKAGGTTKSVTAAAGAKTATVDAADITSVEDFGLSFSGAITNADLADGDKYTFTANGLTVTAKEKDTKSIDKTGTVWVEADGVDLDGTTAAGKLDVENAGAEGDTVTITYTKGETDIKVVDSTGADITNTASEEGKFTFALTADSASKFTVSGDGVTVSKVEVTAVTIDETDLAADKKTLGTGGYEYTLNSKAVGDEVVITYEDEENFEASETNVKADVAVTGAADGTTDSDNKTYTFKLTAEMVEAGKFVVTGNGHVVTKVTVKHTATENKTPTEGLAIKDTKTPATVTVAADKFADVALVDGSTLTVGTAKTGENDGTITIKAGDVVITENTAPAESYTLNAEQAAAVKANGLTITGSGIKLCQVDYRVKGETTKGQTITLFSGSDSVVWSETYAAETQTWETLVEDTAKTTVSTDKLDLGTLSAFSDKYENITAAWTELTAVKVTPDKPTVKTEEVDYPLYDVSYDLSKTALKVGAFPFNTGDSVIVKLSSAITNKVQLYKADGETLIKEENVVSNESDNTVTFKLSESEAAEITANGFVIKGTEGTVTQLSFDKSKELGSFTNNNAVPLSELKGKGVKNARVTLNVTKYDSNGYATFNIITNCDNGGYKVYSLATEKQYENGAGQSWQAKGKITKTGETTAVVDLDLTGDELNFYDIELKTDNYDVLSGELVKVEFLDNDGKVVKTYPAPVQPEKEVVEGTLPYTGSVDLSAKKLKIAAADVAADGTITVGLEANVTTDIVLNDSEGKQLATATPEANAASVVFKLTAEQAEKITANGFIVTGEAGTVTSVAYKASEPPVDKSQTIKEIDNTKAPISKVSAATKAKITVNVTTLTDGAGVLSFYTNSAEENGGGWKQVDYGTDAADTENKITATGEMTATVDFPITDKDQWYQIGVKTSDPDVINGELVKIEFVNAAGKTIYTYDPNESSIGAENFTFSTLKNEEMKVGDSFTIKYDSKNTPKNAKYRIKYKIHAPNDPDAWEDYIYPEVVNTGKIDNSNKAKTGLNVTSATEGTVTTFTFTAVSKSTVEPFGITIELSPEGTWNDTQYPWFGDVSFLVKSAADEDTTKIDINAANFPDANFRKVLTAYSSEKVKNVPVLTEADIAKITDLGNEKADGSKVEADNLAKVVNFKGIEKLTALKSLTLTNTQRNFKALDLSENAALTFVDVSGCTNLADLKLPETAAIETLLLQKTAITAVDVSKYTGLKVLNVSDTKLTALDVKANTELETIALANVKVAELDVKANTKLKTLDAANCGLTKIDVSANTLLEDLDVSGNSLITLDLTGLTALTADKFKADNNKRNIGTVIDNTYDLKDLVADGLDVDKMTITTEGVTRNENVLTDVKGNVTYTYKTGLETEGLDKVTFTLAPEKVTSDNFEVSYMDGAEKKSVVCETWDEVLKTMTDKNVDYRVEVKKDVAVDKLTMPTAAKAKSVTVACTGNTITTKSASVTLPTNTKLENVKIKALDKDGKTLAKTFTLNASKNLTVASGLEIEAEASTIKGGAKSVLETVKSVNEFNYAITGFGTVLVDNGAVKFNNTVKVKELAVENGSVVEIGKNAAVTVTNITSYSRTASKLIYTDAEYKPVAVTGNITGETKLEVGISYKKTVASTEEGQEPTTTTVSRFAKDDVVLVSKNANLAAVDASEFLPEGTTLGRDKSDIKVMDTVATLNGVEYAQWSDITSTIAAVAKADKNFAKTAVYNITLSKELDAKGALKMPAAGTFGELIIKSDAAAQTLKFTGNLALTGKTTFENVKLDSVRTVRGVSTSYDFSISAGKNDLTLSNVTSGKSIKSISSNGTLLLDNVTVTTVNGATVAISNSSTAQHSMGALDDGKWKGEAAPDTSVLVEGNLTAKTALRFVGNESGLRVKGVVNAAKITANNSDSVLVIDKLAKNKNALIIGKGGFDGSSKAVKFVLMDAEKDETAQITENLTLGTIAGPYADQFIPSDSNLAESDSYYIIKSGKNLVAVPKQTKGEDDQKKDYLVEVTVNGNKAYYKSLDEAIKDISATGTKTDKYSIKLTGDQKFAKLPLPSAGKYNQLAFTADSDIKIDVTSDLTLTGNVFLGEHVFLNKVDRNGDVQPISVNVGKYIFASNAALSGKTADGNTYNQINNINGKGTFIATGDITVSGKVNVDTFVATGITTLGNRSAFAASTIVVSDVGENDPTLKYPVSIAKNVKIGIVDNKSTLPLVLDITGDIKSGDQVAALTGNFTSGMVKLTDELGDKFTLARSGNKLVVLDNESNNAVVLLDADNPTTSATTIDSYANAINEINRLKDANCNYVIGFSVGEYKLPKLTLPAKGKYNSLTMSSITDDEGDVVLSVNGNSIALTGNLIVDGDVTIKQTDGKELKFTSAKKKDQTPVYSVTVKGNAKIENGTLNKAPIKNPKTVVDESIPFTSTEGVDLSTNILKIAAKSVVENGSITVTLKNNVTSAIVLNDADGNELTKAIPDAGASSVIFILTADQAEKITANGFTVTGDAGVVTAVKYAPPSIPATEKKGETFGTLDYSGSVDLTLYVLKINAKSDVAANGTITVTLQEAVENSIEFRRAADGDALKTIAPTSGSNTYTWKLSNEDVAYIQQNGFYICGTAGVVTSVTYKAPQAPTTPEAKGAYEGSLNYNGDGIDLSRSVLLINKKAVVEKGTITVTLKEEVTSSVIFKKTNQTDVIKTVAPTSGSTTYTWVLSAEDAAYIAENGFVIDGTEGVLTSVTYTAPEIPGIDD